MTKLTGKFYFKLTTIVFTTLFVTFLLFDVLFISMLLMTDNGLPEHIAFHGVRINMVTFTLSLAAASLIIGLIVGLFWIRGFVTPLYELKTSMNEVSKGKFVKMENTYENKEIGELVKSFNIMVEGLNKLENISENFMANVSHEFKTPLATIKGYTTLLEDSSNTEEERKEYISYIDSAVNRLTNLTNSILLINKINNNEIVEITKYSLDDQIREVVISLEQRFESKNIKVNVNIQNVMIESAKDLLMSVWINLLDNAIKFTPEGGEIKVSMRMIDEKIKVIISDNGIGMKPDELVHVFDRFYQADTSHSLEGNGLGLSLVKTIIDKVKGKINVTSEYNKGTTFIIEMNTKAF